MAPPEVTALDAFNPFDPAVLDEPWEYYRALRREAPVYRDPDREAQIRAAHLILEFQRYFARRLDDRRRDRRDDIISDLVHAHMEDERPLDTAECLSILQQLLVAGNETTAASIAEGVLLLIRNPTSSRAWKPTPACSRTSSKRSCVWRRPLPTCGAWRTPIPSSVA